MSSSAVPPAPGTYVNVHYRATLANGTLLTDSRTAGEALELRMGLEPTEAVPGWELALPQMRVGERAKLVCAPKYAFGEAGSPPLIPPNATVHFDLELVGMRNLVDSNNTEEVDLSDRYADLAARDALKRAEPRANGAEQPAEEPLATPSQATPKLRPPGSAVKSKAELLAERRAKGAHTAAGDGLDGPVAPGAGARRGWTPSATRLEVEHPGGYSWRETDAELEVRIPLPRGVTTAEVSVQIDARAILVRVRGEDVLAGALCGRLNQEESIWSVLPAVTDDEPMVLQLDLMKHAVGEDAPLWGYILAEERDAAAP